MSATKKSQVMTDAQLVSAVAAGNVLMAEVLYDRCRAQFIKGTSHYSGISGDDKGDILQDSFIILWRKIESGDLSADGLVLWTKGRSGTREVADLMAYFMRIVRNKYLETLRLIGRTSDTEITSVMRTLVAETSRTDDEEEEEEVDNIVARCFMLLPRRCQELIDLFYVQGKTLDEIISLRGGQQTYKGVKTAKYKCLKSLRERVAAAIPKKY